MLNRFLEDNLKCTIYSTSKCRFTRTYFLNFSFSLFLSIFVFSVFRNVTTAPSGISQIYPDCQLFVPQNRKLKLCLFLFVLYLSFVVFLKYCSLYHSHLSSISCFANLKPYFKSGTSIAFFSFFISPKRSIFLIQLP